MFEDLMSGGSDIPSGVDVLKDLLDPEDIEMKTDLNISQIKVITGLDFKSRCLDPENDIKEPEQILIDCIQDRFMRLMVSLKRQSRTESIKGVSEMNDKFLQQMQMQQSFLR